MYLKEMHDDEFYYVKAGVIIPYEHKVVISDFCGIVQHL